jgi:hypothetical protein
VTVAPTQDGRIWHFCDMEKYGDEGNFEPGSGRRHPQPFQAAAAAHRKDSYFSSSGRMVTDTNQCPDSPWLARHFVFPE